MLEAHPTTPRSGPARFETGDGTINAQMSLISAREAASKLDKSPGTFYRIGRMSLSGIYGPSDEAASIDTLSAAMKAIFCSNSDESQRMRRDP